MPIAHWLVPAAARVASWIPQPHQHGALATLRNAKATLSTHLSINISTDVCCENFDTRALVSHTSSPPALCLCSTVRPLDDQRVLGCVFAPIHVPPAHHTLGL